VCVREREREKERQREGDRQRERERERERLCVGVWVCVRSGLRDTDVRMSVSCDTETYIHLVCLYHKINTKQKNASRLRLGAPRTPEIAPARAPFSPILCVFRGPDRPDPSKKQKIKK